MRAKLGRTIGQQPPALQQPIGQVRPDIGEPKLGHPPGDPLVAEAPSLAG